MSESIGKQALSDLLKMVEEPAVQDVSTGVGDKTGNPAGKLNEVLELGDDFDFEGFEVVRREFFAHTFEPSVTFNNCKFYVNSACLNKFPGTNYVQVLINRKTQIMALRPCEEGMKDSFAWCSASRGKRKPKQTTCKLFFAKVFDMMGWNPHHRYKLLGHLIHAKGEYLIAFDMTATEVYERTITEGAAPKKSRTPVYPLSWQNQFGVPYNEHRQSMQINIFDGYAIYAIKDAPMKVDTTEEQKQQPELAGGVVE